VVKGYRWLTQPPPRRLWQIPKHCSLTLQPIITSMQIVTKSTPARCFERLQVSARVPSAAVQSAAQRLSRGNASLALELVGYNADLRTAMQYVFGGSFVCKVPSPLRLSFIGSCPKCSFTTSGSTAVNTA
jgi:hypothetical protein